MQRASEVSARAAAVSGAAHLARARNGQDAAACWSQGQLGVAVVCDGCGSTETAELGALLVSQRACAMLARRLLAGESLATAAPWQVWRAELARELARLARDFSPRPGSTDELTLEERGALARSLLCTLLVAVVDPEHVSLWALGDGALIADDELTVLGPFADNAPPYLAYDLVGPARPALFVSRARGEHGVVAVATDGAAALGRQLCALVREPRVREHPDALRRALALAARPSERIVWTERRIERAPARLQDDAALAVLSWGRP